MKRGTGERLAVMLLVLALAGLLAGCRGSTPVSADGGAGDAFGAQGPAGSQGIPVTGMGLELAGCDPRGTYLNFRLSGEVGAEEAARVEVEFDGRPARCHHPLGDERILSCTIPALTMFPTTVVVKVEEGVIAQFSYDGASCPAAVFQVQASQTAEPALVPVTGATMAGLTTEVPTTKPRATSWWVWPTLPPLPTLTGTWTGTALPSTATEPPPATVQPTWPAGSTATEPPPSQPPATTEPKATPTDKPAPTDKPSPTPKPPPTQKPSPTPRPTHPPGPPTDPPTQPATEPPPTPAG